MGVKEVKLEERRGGLQHPSLSNFLAYNQGNPLPPSRFIWWVSCGAGWGSGVLSYFSMFWQHSFPMMSTNTHYDEAGDKAHNGGESNSWLGESLPPWVSPRSSQLSLPNWGYLEVIENNLRSMSMENVYLNEKFLNAYPRGEEHRIFSMECW